MKRLRVTVDARAHAEARSVVTACADMARRIGDDAMRVDGETCAWCARRTANASRSARVEYVAAA